METGHKQGKRGFGSNAAPPLKKNVQTYQLASIRHSDCDRVETPSMKGDTGGAQSGETQYIQKYFSEPWAQYAMATFR
uniref:Uncharacterized protein n=1 Tax=Chromera velia CCMP2878 TaxID=1169474 RepID=A0A0G4I3S9_9ALVE|eukprot:Cvel_10751.t1-p1 / transcript=Cvel_10751.t1 / gene=Cvel_10751 / organism=Chromera_velia_CCMP2878 / gene_product=hypothetical protein / transcript_product=hypothetical protein / location=Cvel_scaffold656:23483-23713(-) / protein_length=77 / sequence_SO=supercontig / SO=protein_coding / is_pseudo=false